MGKFPKDGKPKTPKEDSSLDSSSIVRRNQLLFMPFNLSKLKETTSPNSTFSIPSMERISSESKPHSKPQVKPSLESIPSTSLEYMPERSE